MYLTCADPEGGGPDTPPRFVRGGVLCGCLVDRSYYYIFFLARFARQYFTYIEKMFEKFKSLPSSKSLLPDRHTHDPWLS